MKQYMNLFFIAMFLSFTVMAQTQQIGANKVVVGNKTAIDKTLEFNINQGAANPKIKANATTNKLQFAQDGVNFKDVGSGSGSGGSGINLLTESGFESGINVGWTSSGGTYSEITSGSNLLYQTKSASFQASATGQFFETVSVVVPEILKGQNCMAKIAYKGGDSNLFLTVLDGASVNVTNNVVTTLSTQTKSIDAKLYFICPSSGSIKLRVQSTAASASAFFDEAHLGSADVNSVAGITSEVNYTPTFTGFGTPTGADIKYSRVGKKLKVIARFVLGTTTATTASVSLPNGWTISNKYTSTKIFGLGNRLVPTAATKNYSIIASPNDTSLKFSANGDTQTPNPITPILGTDIGSSGQELAFSAEMEINEFSESELVVNSKCSNDISCENTFGARVDSADAVTAENLDWINGNCTSATTGKASCIFNPNIFTSAPNCVAVATSSSNVSQHSCSIALISSTQIDVDCKVGTADTNLPFSLSCQKTGSDFKAKQNITGFFSQMLVPVGFSARSSSGQSIPSASATTLVMPNENYDSHNAHDVGTGVFTAPEVGKYSCSCRYTYASFTPATNTLSAQIVKNGVLAAENFYTVGTTANTYSQQVTFNDALIVGDQIRCAAFQNTGSARALAANTAFNEFSCNKVGN